MSESQESSVTLVSQYIIARKRDASVYVERNNPILSLMNPPMWARIKEYVKAKGIEPFVGVVHVFRANTGQIEAVCNTDAMTPTVDEHRLMKEALLLIEHGSPNGSWILPDNYDDILRNLQEARVRQVLNLDTPCL